MELPSSPEQKFEYLDLTAQDKERLSRLHELQLTYQEAIESDNEFRQNLGLSQEELDRMKNVAAGMIGLKHKLVGRKIESIEPTPEERIAAVLKSQELFETDRERSEYYTSVIERIADNSGFDAENIISSLKEAGTFYDVAQQFERYVSKQSEPHARKLLEVLEQKSFEASDACFTTIGISNGSTKLTREDRSYDSIYFLYRMSSGAYVSQRFKRNIIVAEPLGEVIQPPLDLALFVGKNVDPRLTALLPRTYGNDEVSTQPRIGMSLVEYYTYSFKDAIEEGNIDDVNVPLATRVIPEGVVISEYFSAYFDDDHEGTEVNSILK